MKRLSWILYLVFTISVCNAQQTPTITVEEGVREMTTDLDARAYFPKSDINDRLCALLKVTVANELRNPLILENGGLGVVAREEKPNGEVWFYLPAQTKNLYFTCKGYKPLAPIPVVFKEGTVYRLTLNPSVSATVIFDAMLSTNYFKLAVSEQGTLISMGKTKEYELFTKNIDEHNFAEMLDYGTYYYKVEHPLFEPYFGEVTIDASTTKQEITLTPAYGYLDIETTPSGAVAYVNNRRIGTTPCSVEWRLPKGSVELRLVLDNYYTSTTQVTIVGDGSRQRVSQNLKPRFADVTITCPDGEAEIWVDNEYKGKGSWSGRLGSMTKHFVESRREGYKSQSLNITVQEGVDETHTISAPVPLYGTINITTTPLDCTIAIDGKVVGESPYIGKLLVGNYEVTLSKDGYLRTTFPVTIENNKVLDVAKVLEKGRLKADVQINCVDVSAEMFVNGKKLSSIGAWKGTLEEGNYTIEARKNGCVPSRIDVRIEGTAPRTLTLNAPKEANGTLSIKSRKGANVTLRSANLSRTAYNLEELQEKSLPVGKYKAFVTKKGYKSSSEVDFEIRDGEHVDLDLMLESLYTPAERLRNWCFDPASHSYAGRYFAEVTWDGVYWGANLGVFLGRESGGHLGIHGSLAIAKNGASEFAVGPLFRLGVLGSVESHIYTGVGYNTYLQQPKYEAGLRFAYDFRDTRLNLSSLSVGAVYIAGTLFPKFGVSMLPATIFFQEKDTNVAWHIDALYGFGQSCEHCGEYDNSGLLYGGFGDEYFLGIHCAYTPNRFGWYGNILWDVEFNSGVRSFTTGPTLSLYRNNIYLYGGVGMVDRSFGYDVGLTLAYFYDFSIGYQWNNRHQVFTFGFGFPFGGDDNGWSYLLD